jgi:small subunit ribosomal protein S5
MAAPTTKHSERRFKEVREEKEFDQKIIDLARVTRVMAGGKRMRFRAAVVIGDHKGRVGFGLAKGADVSIAIGKAVRKAEKGIITVNLTNDGSIPHELFHKEGAAKIMLKPAAMGHGVKAGGAMRIVLELAGVENITGKMLGSGSKINNSRAMISALQLLKKVKN